MKKILISIFAATMALAGNAQLLWKVTGNGNKGTCYIFGTHHIAPIAVLDSVPGFAEALKGAETVYGEIDMTADAGSIQAAAMSASMAPSDSTLSKVMDKQQLDSLNAVLAKYTSGMVGAAQLEMLKPSVVATQIALMQNMVAFPEFAQTGEQIDMSIQKFARESGKPVKGLETIEEQFELLMGDPIGDQVEALMKSVRNDGLAVDMAKRLAAAYRIGDLAEMEKVMFDPSLGMDSESAEKMIFGRNAKWAAQLAAAMKSGTVLVAVGAGHLPGDKGLLQLLRNDGFTVEPVVE